MRLNILILSDLKPHIVLDLVVEVVVVVFVLQYQKF